jgi:TRAP-type C4-dicarboxylate transport system permease small subunit
MDTNDLLGEPHVVEEHDALEHFLVLAAKALALTGGIIFCALVLMSIVSIVGRKVGLGPITGDLEIMQTGTAVAAGAFIPYCTIMGDHLKVEFFTDHVRPQLRGVLDAIGNLLLSVVFGVLTWRTGLQAIDGIDGEVTALLGIPVWWPTALLVPCFMLAAACALHLAWDRILDLKRLK